MIYNIGMIIQLKFKLGSYALNMGIVPYIKGGKVI